MLITVASAEFSDAAFLVAVADCSLPLEQFRHGDHLRLAWLEVHALPFPAALDSVRTKIAAFAAHHGKAAIYHETITTAWVALLASHQEPTFSEFLRANGERLNKQFLERFWRPGTLFSTKARDAWVPPDREPLPIDPEILNSLAENVR